jgi:hypothetical protein
MERYLRVLATAAAAVIVVTATWWVISPMRSAGFGVIDDHEIVAMLDGRDRLPIVESPGEVIDRTLEPVGRFRPVYWLGRAAETSLHGDRPSRWYLDRIVLAAGSALLLLALRRWLHPILGVAPGMAIIAGPHSETWTRLGPSEAFAVPLLVAGIVILVRHVASGRSSDGWLNLAFVLLPAAGLAKENFLLVTSPIILASLLTPRLWKGKARTPAIAAGVATVATAVGIVWQVRRFGDVYRLSRSLSGSFDKFTEMTEAMDDISGWVLVVVATSVALLCGRRFSSARNFLALVLGGLALLVLPQAWFYSGDVLAPRYYYPAVFFVPLVLTGALCSLWAARRSVPAILGLLVVLAIAWSHLWDQARAVRKGAVATSQFVAQFEPSVAEATSLGRPKQAVVIFSADPARYYEAMLSTGVFVRTRFGPNHPPIMLQLPNMTPPIRGTLSERLVDHLREISTRGGDGFVPFSPTPDCLAVLLGPTTSVPCTHSVTVRGVP